MRIEKYIVQLSNLLRLDVTRMGREVVPEAGMD